MISTNFLLRARQLILLSLKISQTPTPQKVFWCELQIWGKFGLPIYNVSIEFSFRHLKLTAEQKCDIAQRELEELRDEIEKLKDESEKILDNFRVGQQILLIKLLDKSANYLRENFDDHTCSLV